MTKRQCLVPILASSLLVTNTCGRAVTIDYRSADPIADARHAFAQNDYRVLGVRVHDSVLTPIDSGLPTLEVNVQLPQGPVRFLAIAPKPGVPELPADEQLTYIKRYNTEMYRQLGEESGRHRRP